MLFTSPVFLLLFLPIMLGAYTLTPHKYRGRAICFFSLAFYTLANLESPASVLFLFLCAIFTYCATFAVFSVRKNYVMVFVTLVLVGILAVLRYLGVWADEDAARQFIPFGASFYLLASFSCISDVRRGDAKMPRSFIDVLTYITFFPVMIVGPIIKYKNFEKMIRPENISFSASSVGSGIILFARGFIKRVAIAAIIDEYYDSIVNRLIHYTEAPIGLDISISLALLLLVAVYFAFSGFSDMGRGISAMLGIPLAPDFGSCILAYTPTLYARNFLSSLTSWITDYIREPLSRVLKLDSMSNIKKRFINSLISVVCALALLLWFKIGISVLPAIAILLLPSLLDAFFGIEEFLEKHKFLKPVSFIISYVFLTVFWMLIKTRDMSVLEIIFGNMTLSMPLQSYIINQTFFNLEFPLVLTLILFVQLPMIFGVIFKKRQSPFVRSGAFRWCWSMLILILFVFCIYYYLPQYPDLATEPFRDIIF
ncbi:MAG: hypothetical protein IJD70_09585 [Clostridia bacterium]|nr:hypothetical protein [Clostridia bacterium]